MKQKMFNQFSKKFIAIAALGASALSACGPQAFVPGTIQSNHTAGHMNIPPKVDIVLAKSDGGTMQSIYPSFNNELNNFVNSLQASGWDYRFVTMSLSEYSPGSSYPIANRVSASKFHSNWLGQWISPYPGALISDPQLALNASLFNQNMQIPGINYNYNDGRENGFRNISEFVNRSDVNNGVSNNLNGILRTDALMAVIVLSNGRDTSDGWYQAWNGLNPNPINVTSWVNSIRAAKSSNALTKMYALISPGTTCRGYNSWAGTDYAAAALATGGISQDICTTSANTALNSVASHLNSQKLNFRKRFLILENEPNPTTIKVFKIVGGVETEIPQGGANGWNYVGLTTQFTIDAPVNMAQATGYMVELFGTAKITGNETARVEYMNANATSSH